MSLTPVRCRSNGAGSAPLRWCAPRFVRWRPRLQPRQSRRSSWLAATTWPWYCEYVPNVTVSLPEDVYRRARIRAAEQNTSVSALVRGFLVELGTAETEFERLRRLQDEVLAALPPFSARGRMTRDEAHDRALR